jgi:hypothetical protein
MGRFALVFILSCICGTIPFGVAQAPAPLRVTSVRYNHKLPLVEALRTIGLHVKGGFISFGVDISGETEPEVYVDIPDTDLNDALKRITSQIPGYASEIISEHVVEIYAAKERANQDDPLNLPIREFSVKDVPAAMILSSPTRYIPELKDYLSKHHSELGCGSIGPGLGSGALGVTLSLTGRNVRQVLDSVAEADAVLPTSQRLRLYPVGWVHRRRNDAKLGLVDTWSAVSFAPHDWKLYAPK